MEIRKLVDNDFEQWNAMRTIALELAPSSFGASNEDEQPHRKGLFERNTTLEGHFIIGVFNQDQLIGIAGFYRSHQPKVRHKGTVWSVFIHPDQRGKGLGKKLMEETIRSAFEFDGLERILLGASARNQVAISLYKSLGFKEYGCEPRCLKIDDNYFDEVLMALDRADYRKG
ncbi:MAG: GNAT family N-acetyltransferase [Flavobacteriales bacterium]|nr:GNAT family N-acetyltransferase [Flavobacteriales bacterium]MCB9191666.1 GNAT family N-acetyltransferase [Flavobacteriales bacterium]MCB9203680.1 GNAT family N-acetyltransferase [Flavobacteriales bacterium]